MESYSALLATWQEATFSLSLAPEARRRTIYTAQKLKLNRKSFIAVITVIHLVSAFVSRVKLTIVKCPYIEKEKEIYNPSSIVKPES